MDYDSEPWFFPLGLSRELFKGCPSGQSPLIWGLTQKVIEPEMYAQWASSFYQKPRLQDVFLSERWDLQILVKHNDLFGWGPHCFPVHEWEDKLYVLCLHPMEIVESSLSICYLIGHFGAMQGAWERGALALTKDPKKPEKSDQVVTKQAKNQIYGVSAGVGVEKTPVKESEAKLEEKNTPQELVSGKGSVSDKKEKDVLDLSFSDISRQPIKNTSMHRDKVLMDEDLEKCSQMSHCKEPKEVVASIFHHLKKDFQKFLWFSVSENGDFLPSFIYGDWSLLPSAWTQPLHLDHPNIFRIVFQTGHPFHGPVSINKTNQNYFNQWNNQEAPDHLTVCPVFKDRHCCAFLLSWGKGRSFDFTQSLEKSILIIEQSKNFFKKKSAQSAA